MARGINQEDVDRAADALLLAGERPTIERVRQHLGTGSPNTVTRLLEVWWQALGARLRAQQQKVALPDAPPAVAELASQLWEQALAAATAAVTEEVQSERDEVQAKRKNLDQEAAAVRQECEEARDQRVHAEAALAEATVRLQDLRHLVEHQSSQIADLTRQRDEAAKRADRAQVESTDWRERLEKAFLDARTEREAQSAHLRSVEDRAYGEVDRVRQEIKALKAKHRTDEAHHGRRATEAEAARARAQEELGGAKQQLAAEQARREVLEQQLSELKATLRTKKASIRNKPRAKSISESGRSAKSMSGTRKERSVVD